MRLIPFFIRGQKSSVPFDRRTTTPHLKEQGGGRASLWSHVWNHSRMSAATLFPLFMALVLGVLLFLGMGLAGLGQSALGAPALAKEQLTFNCPGAILPPSICGKKYHDQNGNGTPDPGEPALMGWTIMIAGQGIMTETVTDVDGDYFFDDLQPGTYTVTERLTQGWVQIAPNTIHHRVEIRDSDEISGVNFLNQEPCANPALDGCTAGRDDLFAASDGVEPTNPSPELFAEVQNCSTGPALTKFDTMGQRRCLGHTFGQSADDTCLSGHCTIIGARLTMRLRAANSDTAFDDHLSFYQYNSGTASMDLLWREEIQALDAAWTINSVVTLTLDLESLSAASPYSYTNILAALQDGTLDVVVGDDLAVDYMHLETKKCCNCGPPPADMVGWWTLDETAGLVSGDIAGFANTGIRTNGPNPVTGMVAGALDFDGTNYVRVADHPDLDVGEGDFSIDAWIKTTDNYGTFVSKMGTADASTESAVGYRVMLWSDGRPLVQLKNSSGSVLNYYDNSAGAQTFNDDQWHFIGVSVARGQPGGGRVYVDGSLVYTFTPMLGDLNNGGDLTIGTDLNSNEYFDGTVDELELFKRALDADEFLAIYEAESAGKCKTGLICGIKFNDLNGNGVQDGLEPVLPGWTIELQGLDSTVITSTVTGPNGDYCIEYPAGEYIVAEQQQPGWIQTFPPAPGIYTVTVPSTPAVTNINFGNQLEGQIKPPDLAIRKQGDSSYTAGGSGTFTLTVTNIGGGPTTGTITVVDTLPTGLTPTAAAGSGWSCSIAGQTVTCTHPGPLGPSGTLPPIIIDFTVSPNMQNGSFNCATVDTPGDTNPQNDENCVDFGIDQPTGKPDLAIRKQGDSSYTAGGSGTFTLTVTNIGSGATTGTITVVDTLPTGLTPTAAVGSGWSCSIAGQTVTCTHPGPLGPSGTLPPIIIDFTVSPNMQNGSFNCATVDTPGDTNPQNDENCVDFGIEQPTGRWICR